VPRSTREIFEELRAEAGLPILHWHGEVELRDSDPQLVQDLLPEVGSGLISGQWGTYKTFAVFDLAHAIMSGEPFLGHEVVRRGGVLFVALEGQSEVVKRLEGVIRERGKLAHPAPFAWVTSCPPLVGPDVVEVLTEVAKQVAARLKERFGLPLVAIFIDTVVAAAGYTREGADNDTALGQVIMRNMSQVARNVGCFAFGVDHFGKDVSVGTRGTSAKEGAADVVLAMLGDKAITGEVSNTRLVIRKRRGGANGEEFPFTPRVVELERDNDGRPTKTTLVLDWGRVATPPRSAQDNWGKGKGVKLLRRIVMSMLVDQGIGLKPFADGPTVRALKVEQVRAEFFKFYYTDGETAAAKQKAKRVAFQRAVELAIERGTLVVRESDGEGHLWLTRAGAAPAPAKDACRA
jgi:AAA domain